MLVSGKSVYQGAMRLQVDFEDAKIFVIKVAQLSYFPQEIEELRVYLVISRTDPERKRATSTGFIRSWMRETSSGWTPQERGFGHEFKAPCDPTKEEPCDRICTHIHVKTGHQVCDITMDYVSTNGFWVPCVTCRRLRGTIANQMIADSPVDRLTSAPPFTYCGVDYFRPFEIKEWRSTLKRYIVVFTCMACRVIYLEIAASLYKSWLIYALRRFIAVRIPILLNDDNRTFH